MFILKSSYLILFLFLPFHLCQLPEQECLMAQHCVTDLEDTPCPAGQYLRPGSSVSGCCPSCQPGNVPPGVCAPPANCLPDGSFAPVQCKGDHFTGRCFCADSNGSRIFGQMWRDEATEMSCACSRRRSDLLMQGRIDVTLHCTRNGDYEPLQCDSGFCWCTEPKTGQPTTPPVPERDMTWLPCYSATQQGSQYLRQCESTVLALANIRKEQMEHGTVFFGNPTSFCDYDGSYAPFQTRGSQVYCTGRDDEILGAWQVDIADMEGMNCNCARDTVVYFPERGLTVSASCLGNGNYRPNQMSGGRYYCVDSDGYPTTEFMDELPTPNYCATFA